MKKIKLPKASKGVVYPRLFTIEMNNFDAEELLPSLFFLVVTRGRKQVGSLKKVTMDDLRRYVNGMIESDALTGFEGGDGRRLLERWLRTSIMRISAKGRLRSEEQIEHLLPLTLLTYKAGLPRWQSRLRKVHVFLYGTMLGELRRLGTTAARARHRRAVPRGAGPGYRDRTGADVQRQLRRHDPGRHQHVCEPLLPGSDPCDLGIREGGGRPASADLGLVRNCTRSRLAGLHEGVHGPAASAVSDERACRADQFRALRLHREAG